MAKLETIETWAGIDTIQVPDGYDLKSIPDLTRRNIGILIDEHNKLVEAFNELLVKLHMED